MIHGVMTLIGSREFTGRRETSGTKKSMRPQQMDPKRTGKLKLLKCSIQDLGTRNMEFANLTPHEVKIVHPETGEIVVIPPSGDVARIEEVKQEIFFVSGIPLVNPPIYKGVVGMKLPVRQPTIVSLIVAEHIPANVRQNIYSPASGPGLAVRGKKGELVGCHALIRWEE